MCALGRLFESFTASDRLSVGAAVSVRSRDKAQIDLRSNLTLFDDPTQQIDSIDTYKRRDTQVLADMAASRLNPSPLSALVWTSLDVWDSIEESILHGIDHDKSFDAYMTLNLTNVFSAPVALSKYMIGSLLLQDVDGVEPHAVLMAATLFHADFAPNTRHEMGSHFSSKIQPTVLLPGEQMSTKVTVPMHWESVVRYMDEMYMKNQNCLDVAKGRADLVLHAQATTDAVAPNEPFELTIGFSPGQLGSWKRRACHLPSKCKPKGSTVFSGGCTHKTCTVRGSAKLTGGGATVGGISLVTKSMKQQHQSGAAFSSAAAPLLDGFTSSFEFEIARECTSHIWGWCKPLSGGFAFVLHAAAGDDERGGTLTADASAPAPPLGQSCEVHATVVQAGQTKPEVPGLIMSNDTTISCVGYAGIPVSVGVVFSLESGPVGNRYWTVAAPVVSSLSDWPRGSLSLYVNGDVRNTTSENGPAHGIAQHGSKSLLNEGKHSAIVSYAPATRMLYVTLDGAEQPNLWAELDPAELGLGPKPQLRPGFTGTAPASGEGLSIDISNWSVSTTRTDSNTSRLLEDAQAVGAVGQRAAVHIDARDSCELPRVTGGLKWRASILDPSGEAVKVEGVDDLGDGISRVRFTPLDAGKHELLAELEQPGEADDTSFKATFDIIQVYD